MKFPLFVVMGLISASAAATVGGLPHVNPNRTVSAKELYGVVPYGGQGDSIAPEATHSLHIGSRGFEAPAQPQTSPRPQGAIPQHLAMPQPVGEDLLIPNRPSGNLWAGSTYAPLRMPDAHEYRVIELPPERMPTERPRSENFVRTQPAPPVQQTAPTFAEVAASRQNNLVNIPVDNDVSGLGERLASARPEPVIDNRPPSTGQLIVPAVRQQQAPSHVRSVPRASEVNRDALAEEFAYQGEVPLSRLSPSELKRAFRRTFTSENRHLSAYRAHDGFDDVSRPQIQGVHTGRGLSEEGGIRPLEIRITFDGNGSSLSRDTYNLLAEYAGIVAANPQRAVQISISERGTRSFDGRKLAARRLAIIEQVLKDSGVVDKRIIPVLSQRNDDAFVLRVISSDMFYTLTERRRDMFGDEIVGQTHRSLAW